MTTDEFREFLRALAGLRGGAIRAGAETWTRSAVTDLAAEIREHIEIIDQWGQPHTDLMRACDLIDEAAQTASSGLAAEHLIEATDIMGAAIETLRADFNKPRGGAR